MKLPRFFIVLGVCTLVFTIALHTVESSKNPCMAQAGSIKRFDPWAGDPDSPGAPQQLPFDESVGSLRSGVQYEVTSELQTGTPRKSHFWWGSVIEIRLFVTFLRAWR